MTPEGSWSPDSPPEELPESLPERLPEIPPQRSPDWLLDKAPDWLRRLPPWARIGLVVMILTGVWLALILNGNYFSNIINRITGPVCPEILYDSEGKGHRGLVNGQLVRFDAAADAPLFRIHPLRYSPNPSRATCYYPDEIPPDDAKSGQAVFPLLLSLQWKDEAIVRGGSTVLSATAMFIDSFPEVPPANSAIGAVSITLTDELRVYFAHDLPAFDPAPEEAGRRTFMLSLSKPIHQEWALFPKEHAYGPQRGTVKVYDEEEDLVIADVTMEVADPGGINPIRIATLGGLVGLVGGLFALVVAALTALGLIPGVWNSWRDWVQRVRKRRRDTAFRLRRRKPDSDGDE